MRFFPRATVLRVVLFIVPWSFAPQIRAAQRPNVVIMIADDLGWGETGYNGHPHLQTPVLNEMAGGGLRFDRFYSAAPVCSPTRASVLTGRHPNRSGVFSPNHATRPEEITVAQILQDAGYRTGQFGKWHVGAVKAECPVNPGRMGFEEYLSHDNFFEMNPPLSHNGADPEIHQGESSQIIVEAAEQFLRRIRSEGEDPFFLMICFGSPHSPYRGLPEDVSRFPEELGEELRHRFAEITAMDRAIGQFRQTLRELAVADDTLFWFFSDNGITTEGIPQPQLENLFNADWRGKKGTLYEGGLRVPAIIEWPEVIRTPQTTSTACVTSDIFPTLLSLLELQSPDPDRPLDGVSLLPLIQGERVPERPSPIGFWKYDGKSERDNPRWMDPELTRGTTPTTRNPGIDFLNFRHPVPKTEDFRGTAAWCENQYKLIVTPQRDQTRTELFDLLADPLEEHDLSEDQPTIVSRMRSELETWQRSVERSLSGLDY